MAKRSGIMLCYPFEEKRLKKWNCPVIVQPKLDGVRCRYLSNSHELVSSSERLIEGVPHILAALEPFRETGIELDGELYNHHLTFEQINSITSRTVERSNLYRDAQFHVFDIVRDSPQADRMVSLRNLSFFPPVYRVGYDIALELDAIMDLLQHHCNEGYEGIVVRHPLGRYERKRSTMIMKFKPRKSDAYLILGWKAQVDKNKTIKIPKRLGALICVGDDGTEFRVGSGFTEEQRHELWAIRHSLPGKYCQVLYQHITPGKGVPRFPVFFSITETMDSMGR